MFDIDLAALAPAEQLSALGEFRLGRDRAEVRILEGVVAFADHHPEPRPSTATGAAGAGDRAVGLPGMERLKVYGGEGCPEVGEFVAADLGAVLGMSSVAAAGLLGDALGLRHRLPRVWARVLAGEARAWRACRIARATVALSLEAVAVVDAKVEKIVDRVGPDRLKDIVNTAMWQADPERAEAQAEEMARARGVWVGRSDDMGTKTLFVRAATGDVIQVEATLQALADALKVMGDTDSVDRRRAKAIGWIADPADANRLLNAARHLAAQQTHPTDNPRTPTTATRQPTAGAASTTNRAPTPANRPAEPGVAKAGPAEAGLAEPGPEQTRTGESRAAEAGSAGLGSGESRSGDPIGGPAGDPDKVPQKQVAQKKAAQEEAAQEEAAQEEAAQEEAAQEELAREELAREERRLGGAGWQLAADGWDQSYVPDPDQRGLDEPPPVEEPPPPDDRAPDGYPSPDGPWPGEPLPHVPLPDVPGLLAAGADAGADDVWDSDDFRRGSLSSRLAAIKDSARIGEARGGVGAARVEVKVHLSAEDLAALVPNQPNGDGEGGSGGGSGDEDRGGGGGGGGGKGGGVMRVEGVGPVLVSRLKEVLGHDKVVVRPVIDLRERASVDGHEIPARIRERVLLRDLYCVFPWCNKRATASMDLDHVVPYRKHGPPGQTSTDNLAPECRYHHRLKTHGGWNCAVLTEGTYEWTSPEGARFVVDHTGTRAVDDATVDTAADTAMDAAADAARGAAGDGWVLPEVDAAAGGRGPTVRWPIRLGRREPGLL